MATVDRLRQVVDSIVAALDEPADGRSMASRALLSRFHFDRVVAAGMGETPTALRRRLLLERAAWRLGRGESVTGAAWSAGFESVEGFSRAFSRAFGVPPGRFATAAIDFRVPSPNGVHFHPPGNIDVTTSTRNRAGPAGEAAGDGARPTFSPVSVLVEHDRAQTDELIRTAATVEHLLDVEVRPGHVVLEFDGAEPTLRVMLDRLVWTKEVWTAAIEGRPLPTAGGRSIEALHARHRDVGERFAAIVADLDAADRWEDAFIDTLCDPPQAFPYGAVVAHVITFAAHRRQVVTRVLAELGVEATTPACPIEWQRSTLSPHPLDADSLRGTQNRNRGQA